MCLKAYTPIRMFMAVLNSFLSIFFTIFIIFDVIIVSPFVILDILDELGLI